MPGTDFQPAQSEKINAATLWLFNIAMENGPFIDGLPIKNGGSFHSYISLPEGTHHISSLPGDSPGENAEPVALAHGDQVEESRSRNLFNSHIDAAFTECSVLFNAYTLSIYIFQ